MIFTERFFDCAFRAWEVSEFSKWDLSSELFQNQLGFNFTINAGLIQSFIPGFASNYSYDTEMLIKMRFQKTYITFKDDNQRIQLNGQIDTMFLTAKGNEVVYKIVLGYSFAFNFGIEVGDNNYTVRAKILTAETSFVPDSGESDSDAQTFCDNLNNILGFLIRYLNKVVLDAGIEFSNPLNLLFAKPTIKITDGALYFFLGLLLK